MLGTAYMSCPSGALSNTLQFNMTLFNSYVKLFDAIMSNQSQQQTQSVIDPIVQYF